MITRPLDLASKLRPEPRNFDWLFFVNAGLLVLFFSLFGSRFVLAPGLGIDFRLPTVAGATAGARAPTHVISVINSGQIFTSDGLRKLGDLRNWLAQNAKNTRSPLLLVRGSSGVPMSVLADIANAATATGYEVLWAASEGDVAARPKGP
jgi:biopolymer transport protein ExbD